MANVFRGMAAGLLAGCAASYLMNQLSVGNSQQAGQGGEPNRGQSGGKSRRQAAVGDQEEHDATVATAQAISRKVFHHELSDGQKQIAGPAVHYAYGSLIGAMYGGLAEWFPIFGAGFGIPFGFLMWLLGDEIAVPALGLGKGPTETPPDIHADALAAHFLYGFTTDLMRRVLRHVL
jgi:hypothetical protein